MKNLTDEIKITVELMPNNKAAQLERLFVIQHLNLCYAVTLVSLLFWGDPVTGALFPTTSDWVLR